jgi:putative Mn2+ efflux pump MntP
MICPTDSMRWFDWAAAILLYVLGTWKLINLLHFSGKKFERWLDGRRRRTDR